jgi:copper transport protein
MGPVRRVAVFATLVGVALVVLAAPAAAHATLTSSSPPAGAALDQAPREIVLRFDEPVEIPLGSIRVYDASRRAVETGKPERAGSDETVQVSLPALGDGGYVVSWRVVSADSHPVSGAFVFTVGEVDVDPTSLVAVIGGSGADHTVGVLLGVARAVSYASLAFVVGAGWFVLAQWPEGLITRRIRAGLAIAWAAGIVAALAGIGLQGAYASGGPIGDTLDPDRWSAVLDTRFGRWWLARAVVLAAGALLWGWIVRRRTVITGRLAASVASVLLAASVVFAGHAATGHAPVLGAVAGTAHVLAMVVWLGGLAALGIALAHPFTDRAALALRFSRVALACVVVLLTSGTLQAWREVPSTDALTHTTYGRLLVAKLAVVAVVIGIAAVSRSVARGWSLRSPRAGGRALASTANPAGATRLARAVRFELAGGIAVLAITAVLVVTAPARGAATGPFEARRVVGDVTVDIVIEPTKSGPNDLHVYVTAVSSNARALDELTITLTKPPEVRGPLRVDLLRAGPNHYVSDGLFVPFSGSWTLDVAARFGEFDVVHTSLPVRFH